MTPSLRRTALRDARRALACEAGRRAKCVPAARTRRWGRMPPSVTRFGREPLA
ncbi:hypothetical protein BMA721280_0053 [Burkholderia mallei 2002721280]|nr:conserved hypothetical protein [Burkholderia pseudomallei MSHR346]EDK86929.1 hypothetical protein BMA721280_0053 [Burkholderia mallei 2002721280]EDS86198.1 hypothetical protein BURPSS13_I0796 [Burkholderia pseudomallei S13]EEC31371.1 conserved hypothetical protein [Burkholderia pseudomallei 576]